MPCDPLALAQAASCLQACVNAGMADAIKIYLLALIAGVDPDPAALILNAGCISSCIPAGAMPAVQANLLCQIAEGGGGGGGDVPYKVTGTTPAAAYEKALVDFFYDVPGLTALEITVPQIGDVNVASLSDLVSFTAPSLTHVYSSTIYVVDMLSLTTVSMPLLVDSVSGGADIYFNALPLLTSIDLTSFQTAQYLAVSDATSLVSLSLPALLSAELTISGCTALVTLSVPLWTPTNTKNVNCSGNALSAASVNHILARCIANPAYDTGTISLDGGTNAAPSGQGIVDAGILAIRGCTVNTN